MDITNREFDELTSFIHKNYGIHLKEEKRTLVTGRLRTVLLENNLGNFTDYFKYLVSDKTGEASITLLNRITTNHTYFMREMKHFYFFRDNVLPYLMNNVRDRDLRIWSAGCSTGEEPYTLAMIIDEFFGEKKASWDTKILATDISNKALTSAIDGVYENEKISGLAPYWRLNYFKRKDVRDSVIVDKIKDEVIFRRFNLMEKEFPFRRKFHTIFCRNVMIYFDSKTKDELVEKFYNLLEPGGYLFIGHSESINRQKTRFKYVLPAVYRKD